MGQKPSLLHPIMDAGRQNLGTYSKIVRTPINRGKFWLEIIRGRSPRMISNQNFPRFIGVLTILEYVPKFCLPASIIGCSNEGF